MSVFRITHCKHEVGFTAYDVDTLHVDEWKDDSRVTSPGWQPRYEYEAKLIVEIAQSSTTNTILEIGPGPGVLSELIQKELPHEIEYHLVDKPFAKKSFEKNNRKGKFFVKDISIDMDPEGLLTSYDMIICNDTLEHLLAPSNVVKKIKSLMHSNSRVVISVPNWRMAHQFIYRGLWDYDNFIYFMHIHGIMIEGVYPSPLQCPFYPKTDAEESMPDELIQSWNWYFVGKLREDIPK
jgi:SAM-dependent methyltransferase